MNERLDALRTGIRDRGLDAMLITSPDNRRYLTGFTGSAGAALVTAGEALLIVDSRYTEQAAAQAGHCTVVPQDRDLATTLAGRVGELEIGRLGFEAEHVSVHNHDRWSRAVQAPEWVPVTGLVEDIRIVKDDGELESIRRAARIADEAFAEILPTVRAGRSEEEIALDLEFCARRLGAEGLSFPLIVASGERSALPHGRASERRIREGDLVTFDYGVVYGGYCSDATRTVAVGEPEPEARRVYETVLAAQRAALDAVRAGPTGFAVDAVAREIIGDAGYGEYFGHGLGHGLGLAVHEAPKLSYKDADEPLRAGMVVTVEPGIYLPGRFGVRIEDLVIVEEGGAEVLTTPTKELVVNRP